VNVYRKAHELGWELTQVSAKRPVRWWVQRRGWAIKSGPEPDTHHATGKKDLEALLLAIEEGRPTDRWRHPQ
jgi:hypothetical protein